MAQITTGIRSILNVPRMYDYFMDSLGARNFQRIFIEQYIRPQPKDRILDVGCGTGSTVGFLPEGIAYIGVDLSPDYIAAAKRQFGDRASFRVGDVNELRFGADERSDIVSALGLLHHLNDDKVVRLAKTARKLLKTNGRLVTIDNCFTEDQSPVARAIIRRDRGRNTRTPAQYTALIEGHFGETRYEVRGDLLRIPYTHVIIEATVH